MEFFAFIARSLVSPLTQVLVILIVSFGLWYANHQSILARKLCWSGLFWLFLCSQDSFSALLLKPLEHSHPVVRSDSDLLHSTNGIAVLACYYSTTPELPEVSNWSDCSLQRLLQAFITYQHIKKPIYVAGGHFLRDETIAYANKAKQLLTTLGVPEQHVHALPTGADTLEELQAIDSAISLENFLIISSATHMRRLDYYLKLMQIDGFVLMPVDHLSNKDWEFRLTLPAAYSVKRSERAIYEYFALAKTMIEDDNK